MKSSSQLIQLHNPKSIKLRLLGAMEVNFACQFKREKLVNLNKNWWLVSASLLLEKYWKTPTAKYSPQIQVAVVLFLILTIEVKEKAFGGAIKNFRVLQVNWEWDPFIAKILEKILIKKKLKKLKKRECCKQVVTF